MKRLLVAITAAALVAATPQDALPGLTANGYYIEDGAGASEQVVSDAVFEGRAAGGQLYVVVLAEEPPGGAPTFSESVLDLLGGDGYVLTIAPETVGWVGDGTFWTAEEMNAAVDASLDGGSDDAVIQIFIESITGETTAGGGDGEPVSSGGGISWTWVLLIGGGVALVWWFFSSRNSARRTADRMVKVKDLAQEKLAEVANDILQMEDEVAVSDNGEVKTHYQRASAIYAEGMEDTERATSVQEMLKVSKELDLAIWELDCAEALLDGKTPPPKPDPDQPVVPPPAPGQGTPMPGQGTLPAPIEFDRRPQRQSGGSNEMLTALMTMMAMGRMRGGGLGGFGGSGGSGGWTGGGGTRMGGGGGRIRGGGRRRG